MNRISCGDLIPGCAFKAQAATGTEVLHIESYHAREAHGIEVTPRFLERARARIVDADSSTKAATRSEAAHPG